MNFGGKKNSVIPQLADLWEKNIIQRLTELI